MNRLESFGNEEYTFVMDQYKKLLSGFLVKKDITTPYFVGGSPVTLTREDVINLFDRSYKADAYKYTATAKVDGTRFMLFITEPNPNTKEKRFYFIDRDVNIYKLINKENVELNTVKLPKMLLDGEMVFYKNNKAYFNLPQNETDFLSYMVFDILFGPPDLYFNDIFTETFPKFKESVAMSGPVGGVRWDYNSRYQTLNKLFVPSRDNNNLPPMPLSIIESTFFRIELKNINSVGFLTDKNIETQIYKMFTENRKNYYNFLDTKTENKKLIRFHDRLKKIKVSFDGIIFTPIDTSYTFGNWNTYKNVQYKWKPTEEQTVDLAVEKDTNEELIEVSGLNEMQQKVRLFFKGFNRGTKQPELVLYKPRGQTAFGLIPASVEIKQGMVCEFGYNKKLGYFIFSRIRERELPNALKSIQSVMKLVEYPVDINIIQRVLNEGLTDKSRREVLRILGEYLTKNQMNRLLICSGLIDFVDTKQLEVLVSKVDPNNELNLIINSPSKEQFENHRKMFELLNWTFETIEEVDLVKGNKTTRYRYFNELKDIVRIFTRNNTGQENFTIKLKETLGYNILGKLSKYNYNTEHLNFEEPQEIVISNRVIFYDPNGKMLVKLSENTPGTLVDTNIQKNGSSEYLIEFNSTGNNKDDVMNFLKFYINF